MFTWLTDFYLILERKLYYCILITGNTYNHPLHKTFDGEFVFYALVFCPDLASFSHNPGTLMSRS